MIGKLTTVLALLGALAISACNTVDGLGQDVEQGGEAISSGAERVEREISQ
jgi:predicted small secreted protein